MGQPGVTPKVVALRALDWTSTSLIVTLLSTNSGRTSSGGESGVNVSGMIPSNVPDRLVQYTVAQLPGLESPTVRLLAVKDFLPVTSAVSSRNGVWFTDFIEKRSTRIVVPSAFDTFTMPS